VPSAGSKGEAESVELRVRPSHSLTHDRSATSLGQVGSAILPFATGALSQSFGIRVLQPVIVSLLGGLAVAWGAVLWFTRLDKHV